VVGSHGRQQLVPLGQQHLVVILIPSDPLTPLITIRITIIIITIIIITIIIINP